MTAPKKKASAPKPKQGGYDAAKERQKRAQETFRISLKEGDLSFVYRPYGIPTYVRGHIRDVTGMSVDELLWLRGSFDAQTICDYWWISRLCASETGADLKPVSRRTVQDQFDKRCPGAIYFDFVQEDISNEVDDSPEA